MLNGSKFYACVLAILLLPVLAPAETVSFQEGVDGYTGTVHCRIGSTAAGYRQDGATVEQFAVDGVTDTGADVDYWSLLRFDNIFGSGPGQIPAGATIVSAQLQLTTATVTNAQAPGPVGIARMLKPFTLETVWLDFGTNGPDVVGDQTGPDIERPVGGYEGMQAGGVELADVTPIVQAWSRGEPNHGVIIIIAGSDGWNICTTGNTDPAKRPRLIVEYLRSRSRAVVFQEGVDEYAGTSMLRMTQNGSTEFGSSILGSGAYLDGFLDRPDPTPDEPDILGLVKFDNVFGEGDNQITSGATILKAFVTLTTLHKASGSGGSYETRARGKWEIHPLLVDVDWTGEGGKPFLWTDFLNGDGPTEGDNEIGPMIDEVEGLVWDSRAWFDITDAVKGWQSGQPNRGLIVTPGMSTNQTTGAVTRTADGWRVHWTGNPDTEKRPQLVIWVASGAADLNNDTFVNLDDFVIFKGCASGPSVPYTGECANSDLDGDGDVDMDDFGSFQACFSGSQPAASDCR